MEQLAERLERPQHDSHRDPRRRASPGQGRGGRTARLDRVLAADLFATSMANGAFGLLYLNPPYDLGLGKTGASEHAFLTHCTRYLAEHGLLVLIVPRPRLAVSARYLSTHYGRLRCWAFPRPEREVFDQIVLMGYRKPDPVPDAYAEDQGPTVGRGASRRRCAPTRTRSSALPPRRAADVLFATRTVDPVAAAEPRPGGRGCGPARR